MEDGATGENFDTQSEMSTSSANRRGRPIARFDDGDTLHSIPNPEV